ncbi:MAG TPA: tautomerase family protein [Bordetella sp.]|jgi:phenylpyruvate tautomerase PptA (4-oxalocrotonate tautomerase family)|nr:tautomerase family protein [Bordetella sp.]
MPVIQLYHAKGVLDPAKKNLMGKRLTEVLLTMEGGARTPGGLAFASVLFTEVPAEDWWVGGTTDGTHVSAPGRLLARVSIPEGYMSQQHKSEVHALVHAAMMESLGATSAEGRGALVIIEEVAEGNWGAGGHTISLASIAESVGLSKDGERYQWVEAYFQAKARQFAASHYPAGTGGLLPGTSTAGPATRGAEDKRAPECGGHAVHDGTTSLRTSPTAPQARGELRAERQ